MYEVECSNCGMFRKFSDENMHPWCMLCAEDEFNWDTQRDVSPVVEHLRKLDQIRDDKFDEWFLRMAAEMVKE